MPELVLIERRPPYALLTLNRPEKRNPLPYRPEDSLLPALEALRREAAIRAVVITGAGKAFCSGLDLEQLAQLQRNTPAQNKRDSKAIRTFFETLREYHKPLIAAINGPAYAGGVGLALCCDFAIAAEDASFCLSEVRVGFVPALVGVYLARALGERRARELCLSARVVPAAEAASMGLVNSVVPAAQLLEKSAALAASLAELSPQALALTKGLFEKSAGLKKALDEAEQLNADARASADCQEGVRAFLEKRKPNWASKAP